MEMLPMILGVVNVLVALLLIGLSIPLLRGKVGQNSLYGFRFPEAFESEAAWFAINRYGAQKLMIWSAPLLLLGIATFFLPIANNIPAILAIASAPLVILIPAFESWRYARRYTHSGR